MPCPPHLVPRVRTSQSCSPPKPPSASLPLSDGEPTAPRTRHLPASCECGTCRLRQPPASSTTGFVNNRLCQPPASSIDPSSVCRARDRLCVSCACRLSFSPVKNSISAAIDAAAAGVFPASPGAAEAAIYDANARLLRLAGPQISPFHDLLSPPLTFSHHLRCQRPPRRRKRRPARPSRLLPWSAVTGGCSPQISPFYDLLSPPLTSSHLLSPPHTLSHLLPADRCRPAVTASTGHRPSAKLCSDFGRRGAQS